MSTPIGMLSALEAKQSFYEAQARAVGQWQDMLGGGMGLQEFTNAGIREQERLFRIQSPSFIDRSVPEIKFKKEHEGIKEELQAETDEWLDFKEISGAH